MSGLTALMLIAFMVMVLIGVPITFSTGAAVMLYLVLGGDIPGTLLVQRMYNSSVSFTMLAVPLFIIAGELMNKAGITPLLCAGGTYSGQPSPCDHFC